MVSLSPLLIESCQGYGFEFTELGNFEVRLSKALKALLPMLPFRFANGPTHGGSVVKGGKTIIRPGAGPQVKNGAD